MPRHQVDKGPPESKAAATVEVAEHRHWKLFCEQAGLLNLASPQTLQDPDPCGWCWLVLEASPGVVSLLLAPRRLSLALSLFRPCKEAAASVWQESPWTPTPQSSANTAALSLLPF